MKKTIICKECGANFVPCNQEQKDLSLCYNCLDHSPRCKAINYNGLRCRAGASIGGYCLTHWKIIDNKMKGGKN